MPADLALLAAPSPLWRVERIDPALRFSQLNPVDAMNERAGNRFDIPGAGVLYGATTPEGGFAETLAGFRPKASMIGAFSRIQTDPGPSCGARPVRNGDPLTTGRFLSDLGCKL